MTANGYTKIGLDKKNKLDKKDKLFIQKEFHIIYVDILSSRK